MHTPSLIIYIICAIIQNSDRECTENMHEDNKQMYHARVVHVSIKKSLHEFHKRTASYVIF